MVANKLFKIIGILKRLIYIYIYVYFILTWYIVIL